MCGCGCGNTALAYCNNVTSAQVLSALNLIAPQFSTISTDTFNGFFSLIQCQVNSCILSCNAALGFAFLMAHYLTIATPTTGPNIGVYSDIKEGELNLSINVDPGMDALNTTIYGRSYINLVKRTVVGSTVSNLPVAFGGVNNGIPLACCNGGFGGYGWNQWSY